MTLTTLQPTTTPFREFNRDVKGFISRRLGSRAWKLLIVPSLTTTSHNILLVSAQLKRSDVRNSRHLICPNDSEGGSGGHYVLRNSTWGYGVISWKMILQRNTRIYSTYRTGLWSCNLISWLEFIYNDVIFVSVENEKQNIQWYWKNEMIQGFSHETAIVSFIQ